MVCMISAHISRLSQLICLKIWRHQNPAGHLMGKASPRDIPDSCYLLILFLVGFWWSYEGQECLVYRCTEKNSNLGKVFLYSHAVKQTVYGHDHFWSWKRKHHHVCKCIIFWLEEIQLTQMTDIGLLYLVLVVDLFILNY